MTDDIYQRLARHLDHLPGRYPATESGIELRILRRLFTPEQAELALHLSPIPEEAQVIARRAGQPVEQVAERLVEMAQKGLCFDISPRKGAPRYMASQFVVGIWEYQVNNLSPELVEEVDTYFKDFFDLGNWPQSPQIRTIPIGASLPAKAEVMAYEQAEQLIRANKRFVVAPCICRKERALMGEACDKPLEVCLSMGMAADYYLRHGLGRAITEEEALGILEIANQAGLVLQPSNTQKASFLCCCCGDCCGVLRNIKRHPRPADLVASPFYAICDQQLCGSCGDCLERCQMEAISLEAGYAEVDLGRCIGCGLCVPTCPTEAMRLVRKAPEALPEIPA